MPQIQIFLNFLVKKENTSSNILLRETQTQKKIKFKELISRLDLWFHQNYKN
jgi:hypothetical protein